MKQNPLQFHFVYSLWGVGMETPNYLTPHGHQRCVHLEPIPNLLSIGFVWTEYASVPDLWLEIISTAGDSISRAFQDSKWPNTSLADRYE